MTDIVMEKYNTTFEVPDKIDVRTRMQWESLFGGSILKQDGTAIIALWEVCKKLDLIREWKSELLPDHRVELEELYDPKIADLMIEATMHVVRTLQERKDVEKK